MHRFVSTCSNWFVVTYRHIIVNIIYKSKIWHATLWTPCQGPRLSHHHHYHFGCRTCLPYDSTPFPWNSTYSSSSDKIEFRNWHCCLRLFHSCPSICKYWWGISPDVVSPTGILQEVGVFTLAFMSYWLIVQACMTDTGHWPLNPTGQQSFPKIDMWHVAYRHTESCHRHRTVLFL